MLWSRPARAQPPIVDGREVDVRGGQDLGRLGEGDPVRRRRPSSLSRSSRRSPVSDAFVEVAVEPDAGVGGSAPSSDDPLAGLRAGLLARRRCRRTTWPSPGSRSRAVPSWPSPTLVVDGRGADRLADRAAAADRAGRRAVGVDAVDDLEPPAAGGAVVVVDGHRAVGGLSRAGGACRTSGSRRPARGPTRTRSGRRPGRPGRRPAPAARSGSGRGRTGWRGCW